jgi:leucyl-tRNA synthetase
MGLVKSDEPFGSLLTQGMVTLGGSAMSKSKGNVVDPNEVISKYGADTCRMFILFAAPPTQQLEWSDKQIEGIWRFLNRVWRLAMSFVEAEEAQNLKRTQDGSSKPVSKEEVVRQMHLTIKKVTNDIQNDFGFNTAISSVMELVNTIYLYPELGDATSKEATEAVIHLLSPFAPHFSEELWQALGHKTLLEETPWPKADEKKMVSSEMSIVVQVNGKVREKVTVASSSNESQVKELALDALKKRGMELNLIRAIYIPNKLINFVVSEAQK